MLKPASAMACSRCSRVEHVSGSTIFTFQGSAQERRVGRGLVGVVMFDSFANVGCGNAGTCLLPQGARPMS